MVDMPDALYLPTGESDTFEATDLTEGPWAPGVQHGGPPSALLARAVERTPTTVAGTSQVARISYDILGPMPATRLRTLARVVRPGRSVELVEAELVAGDRTVMRAQAWRIKVAAGHRLPLALPEEPAPESPDGLEESIAPWPGGYLTAVEWRFVEGQFEKPGPAIVWSRLRVPVVAGDEPTGLQRAAAVADCGNGLSSLLDPHQWWFINTELTVHLTRQPTGDWVRVAARSTLDGSGAGLAETSLADRTGRFGRGAQALMVGPR
jgi:hypothetical protein